jgi:hypothetical protein
VFAGPLRLVESRVEIPGNKEWGTEIVRVIYAENVLHHLFKNWFVIGCIGGNVDPDQVDAGLGGVDQCKSHDISLEYVTSIRIMTMVNNLDHIVEAFVESNSDPRPGSFGIVNR